MTLLRKEEIEIAIHIGDRLRLARLMRKITQQELASEIGISYPQLQKYENGVNRISSPTLYIISNILHVSLAFFFEGLDNQKISDPALELTPQKINLLQIFEALTDEQKNDFIKIIGHFSDSS